MNIRPEGIEGFHLLKELKCQAISDTPSEPSEDRSFAAHGENEGMVVLEVQAWKESA